jgi:hypothetical protein
MEIKEEKETRDSLPLRNGSFFSGGLFEMFSEQRRLHEH